MKRFTIQTIILHQVEIPFTQAISHNLKERKKTQSIVLEVITTSQQKGYGEAAPRSYVTGESIPELIYVFNTKLKNISFPTFQDQQDVKNWIDQCFKLLPLAPSLLAALDSALLDIVGQNRDCSIDHFFKEGKKYEPLYSGVIPFLSAEKFKQVLTLVQRLELPHIKIKVGQDNDVQNLKLAREVLGNEVDIRVDANRSWTLSEAVENIKLFEPYNISAIEEPLCKSDVKYLPELAKEIEIPIILDESVCCLEDAKYYADRISSEKIIFNIKISKVGGLSKASELYHFASFKNIDCQLGCHVGETGVLTAAGRLFAQSHHLRYLEGAYTSFFMADDIVEENLSFERGGITKVLRQPGLGICIDYKKLQRYTCESHQISIKTIDVRWEELRKGFKYFGVGLNNMSISGLFRYYEKAGFLYPEKKKLLAPYFSKIRKNWRKLSISPSHLLWILNKEDKKKESFSSVSVVKYYNKGLLAQHLVSNGNPFLSLETMQAAQHMTQHYFNETEINSSQNWFRPNNRYAYRIFASAIKEMGPSKATLTRFQYLQMALDDIECTGSRAVKIKKLTKADQQLNDFLSKQKGEAFVEGEELNSVDIQQLSIAEDYKEAGLERSRTVLKITDFDDEKIIGAVVINRAALGLNFSFLGNRCMLLLDDQLDEIDRDVMLPEILAAIKPYYLDFELQKIPILTDKNTSILLQKQKAIFLREYLQCIWLRSGFKQWAAHIQSFLNAIQLRRHRQLLVKRKAVS